MLRTLLVGLLAVSATSACSDKSDPPAAVPGATAGKVIELSGKVTATRGTEVRTLASGGEVSGDDVIDTGADGQVAIILAHNNARWDLGPNKHGKVADSLAWTAAKVDRPAGVVTEETSTAGRHAEKNAATTGTTTGLQRNEDDRAAPPPADPGVATPGGPPPSAQAAAADKRPEPEDEKQPAPPSAKPPPRTTTPEPRLEAAKPEPPPPPATDRPSKAAKNMTAERKVAPDMFGAGGDGGGGMGSTNSTVGSKGGKAVDPVSDLQRQISATFARARQKLRACFPATAPTVLIEITVTNGVYTITTADAAATPEARACLADRAKGMGTTTKIDTPVSMKKNLAKP